MKLDLPKWLVKVKGKNIKSDSRKIEVGDVFIAHGGVSVDRHAFISEAIRRGAVAVIGERDLVLSVPYLKVESARLAWADLQAFLAGNPEKQMHFVGVTGTDGKTTTVGLLYRTLLDSGRSVGMISTIEAVYNNQIINTGLHTSTPDADLLFPILKGMSDSGIEWAVLETTSHGLAQERTGNIKFDYGVLTNIGSDHLEFHGNLENYILAKARLFEKSKVSVLNRLAKGLGVFESKAFGKIIYYDPSVQIRNQKYCQNKGKMRQVFEMMYKDDWIEMETDLLGRYNLENILAASTIAVDMGVPAEVFKSTIAHFKSPRGRLEWVKNDREINIVVDFAHTEQGLRAVLGLIVQIKKEAEKILVVFGANGEKDRTKRGPMGRVAAELADITIVTSEDPRNESVDQIYGDIKAGCDEVAHDPGKKLLRIDDRKEAIKTALGMARKGDWVMCLGKGHEQSMNLGGVEYPWDEVSVIKSLLKDTI